MLATVVLAASSGGHGLVTPRSYGPVRVAPDLTKRYDLMELKRLLMAMLAATLVLNGCNDDDDDEQPPAPVAEPFALTILHINDHHSHLQPNTAADLTLAGATTRVEMGGFARVTALFNSLSAEADNLLKLHAGDAITGDLYYTLFRGEADAALMNTVCFDAFALGNHEFDGGDAGLKAFLDHLYSPLCQTPVVAANVVPTVGESPLAPNSATDYIRPYTIKSYGEEQVGIIGIDIATKTKNSSSPDAGTEFLDETTTAQRYIDELTAAGVDKIVLLTHYQYSNDLTLAAALRGVDVIVGGDSHTLLGDFDAYGLNAEGPYPTQVTNADGQPVCVVQAWQYAAVVGELQVRFDGNGVVESCEGTPHLLLGDSFKRTNGEGQRVELAGDERQAVLDAIAADPQLTQVTPDAAAAELLAGFADAVEALKGEVIGQASDNLCLSRIPGDSRSQICDSSETRARGSDISNLVAQAFLYLSVDAELAIQNGGGVRTDIAAGDVTIGDAYLLLPFANTLTNLDMTGAEIRAVLNEAVDYAIAPDGSSGAYPYAAGLRFDVDLSRASGERLFNIETKVKGTDSWVALDDARSYKVVTNSFTAGGRDGYVTFGTVSADGRAVDTYLDYAQSFVDYVKAVGTISKPADEDYSTQNFYDANGNLQQ